MSWLSVVRGDGLVMNWFSVMRGGGLVMSSSHGVVRSLVMSLGAMVRDRVSDMVGLVWVLGMLRLMFQFLVVRILDFAHWGVLLLDVMSNVGLLNLVRLGSLVVLLE